MRRGDALHLRQGLEQGQGLELERVEVERDADGGRLVGDGSEGGGQVAHRNQQLVAAHAARAIVHRQRNGVDAVVAIDVRGGEGAGEGFAIAKVPGEGISLDS